MDNLSIPFPGLSSHCWFVIIENILWPSCKNYHIYYSMDLYNIGFLLLFMTPLQAFKPTWMWSCYIYNFLHFFRGTAVTMKNMLEAQVPGIYVALANYPPSAPKRILGKILPAVQIGVVASIVAGDQIFPRLGISPPPWYYQLRANRFGTISAVWLLGNFLQSTLQSTGAY